MPTNSLVLSDAVRQDVLTLWDYNNMHHQLRPCDVGIGLGSHDPSVSAVAATLYHQHLFPLMVFTGASAPTTVDRFPRGEAVHYREAALSLDVPSEVILVESRATNTGENISFTRALLAERRIATRSVMLITRPYQQRRAYATCRQLWPEVDVICASVQVPLDDYISSIGDADLVVNTLVGDTQRVLEYAKQGLTIAQTMPVEVSAAYARLTEAGYDARLIARPSELDLDHLRT